MKKIILSLFIALCCFSLFAEETVPEWVMSAASGNLKDVAVKLGINTDENKVWIFVNERNVEEKYDLHKYLVIEAFKEFDFSMCTTFYTPQEENFSAIVMTRKTPAGFVITSYQDENSNSSVSVLYEDPSTGLIFTISDMTKNDTIIHGENFNNILTCLKKNSLFQEMKIAGEYYVFTEISQTKKTKKASKSSKSGIAVIPRNPPVIVDYGPKPETDKKYTNCTGYMVVTLPKDLYEQKLTEAMLMIE